MSTRLLEPRDLAAAIDVLSSAFAGDPLLVWACGARERAGMRASCRMTSTLWTNARSAYGYFEGEQLIAVALYQKPDAHVSTWRALRAGFWRVPFVAGPRAAARIIKAFGHADRYKASILNALPPSRLRPARRMPSAQFTHCVLVEKELGLGLHPDAVKVPEALTMGASYAIASTVPLAPEFFLPVGRAFIVSIAASFVVIGVIKGKLAKLSLLRSTAEIVVVGTVSADTSLDRTFRSCSVT